MVPGLKADDVRPVRDKVGFCWDAGGFNRFMEFIAGKKIPVPGDLPSLIAGVSPHDDYLYAGNTYYPLFQKISAGEIVVFGVTHSTVRKKFKDPHNIIILDSFSRWRGPYGPVEISPLRAYLKKNLDSQYVITNNEAHRMEHSIEAMIPFLQYSNRKVRITPIMVTGMPFDTMQTVSGKLAAVVAGYIKENKLTLGKDIFFLISADANHYGKDFSNTVFGDGKQAHQKGTAYDRQLTTDYLEGAILTKKIRTLTEKLWGKHFTGYGDTLWCGKFSIPFGLLTVSHIVNKLGMKKDLKGKIFDYSDTYSQGVMPLKGTGMGITAPFSLEHWVGFFSAGFYLL